MDRLYKDPGLLEAAADTPMPSGSSIPANDKTTPTIAASPYLQKLFNSRPRRSNGGAYEVPERP